MHTHMLLYCFSTTTTLSKIIYVLQHMYYPIHLSPPCFHLYWVSFVGFEPEFGIRKTIFCDHNIFTTPVGSLNPVLRLLQSLTFFLCLHNHPNLYGFAPDNLWDKYNRPLLSTWTHSSFKSFSLQSLEESDTHLSLLQPEGCWHLLAKSSED